MTDPDAAAPAETLYEGQWLRLRHRGRWEYAERTHGKGSAQQLLPGFAEPGAHYATVATVVLPDGQPIEGRGVHPDIEIENPLPPPSAPDLASPEAVAARLAGDAGLSAALAAASSLH